jgi:BirA family biotin operon repressor/biotin-[acetyl-CoA-carboxylase] ligase
MSLETPPFDARRFQELLRTRAIGRFLVYRLVVETTMTLARREASEGAPHGTLVLAEEQTAGRGRRGRSFFSPPGESLYFTLVLRPRPEQVPRLLVATPLAVARACSAEGVAARIKWPNDIWVGDRKLCGMLIDSETVAGEIVAFPGIGINVNADPTVDPELRDTATSLARELGRRVDREALLARICNELEQALGLEDSALDESYKEFSMILGRRVCVIAANREFEGLALALEPGGALRVRRDDGPEEVVLAGEVSLRPT